MYGWMIFPPGLPIRLGVWIMLAEMIREAQNGNEQCMLEMIDKFKRLLSRYARLLRYEDAINDMTLELILLLKQMNIFIFIGKGDGAVVNYIGQAVSHIYIKLSKRHAHRSMEVLLEDLSEEQRYCVKGAMAVPDSELLDFMARLPDGVLTAAERDILIQEFYWGLSSAEIAHMRSVSSQSVNQTKNTALKKLHAIFA